MEKQKSEKNTRGIKSKKKREESEKKIDLRFENRKLKTPERCMICKNRRKNKLMKENRNEQNE